MSKPSFKRKRRKIVIDPKFQFALMGKLGLLLVCYFTIFLMVPVVTPLVLGLWDEPVNDKYLEVATQAIGVQSNAIVPLLFTFVFLFLHGIVLTFHLAGPHFRFRQVLQDVKQGRIPRGVRIRKGDYFQATARDLDESLCALHDRIAQAKVSGHRAMEMLIQMRSKGAKVEVVTAPTIRISTTLPRT